MDDKKPNAEDAAPPHDENHAEVNEMEKEYGGFAAQKLKEPTRYGDWEVKGRCSDF